jgi:histidinol-phosphate phosphatase family protein
LVSHGVPGIIVGTADEWAAGEEIARAAGSSGWRNLCGTASPLEAAELLRGASAAICPDSGAMHLAAAVGSRVVALFGPSEPTWTGPQGGGHRVLRKRWRCAPCYRRHCPYGDPAPCMAMIAPEEVMRATRAIRRRSAVFFDRDGTLIEHVPYLRDPSQVRLLPNVAAALQSARAAGFRLIVASNQSGIARGYFAREHLDAVNGEMCRQLAAQGVGLDAIYTCPHHPDHAGDCKCRKPLPGLLLAAAIDFDLDLSRSFMVGDTVDDLRAGAAAGARPVLIDASGERGDDVLPGSIVVRDLATALAAILAQGARTGAAKAD